MSSEREEGGVPPLSPHDPARIGPYVLLGRLGAGGMGRVYLARSAGGRTVAVKVVHEEHAQTAEFRARFRREIRAAQRAGGPYTAPVLDSDADADPPWVATAYVPGPSLEKVVREHGALPTRSVVALADGLSRALKGIHAAGIVHRDLKPSNVLLTIEGPRVIDFGIARAVQPSAESLLTSTGMVIGSPGFMAPEQVLGETVGPKADIFVLGCVLAYASTAVLPFGQGAENGHAVMYRIVESEPALDGVADESLRDLISGCLAKEADERPDADELLSRCAERHEPEDGELWLPPVLVAHLARQSARLLNVDAPDIPSTGARKEQRVAGSGTPEHGAEDAEDVSGDESEGVNVPPEAPVDLATVSLREKPPAGGVGPTPPLGPPSGDPDGATRRRRRRAVGIIAAAVALVLAIGGTVAYFDDSDDGSPRDDQAAPAASPTRSAPEEADDGKGKDDSGKVEEEDEKDKKDDNDTDERDDAPDRADQNGKNGEDDGSSGSGDESPSRGDEASSTGGSGGSGGSDGGGGDGSQVPRSFLGTWKRDQRYAALGPHTVVVRQTSNGGRAVTLLSGYGQPCELSAPLVGTADGGKRLVLGPAKVTGYVPNGQCKDEEQGSSFVHSEGGLIRTLGDSVESGRPYLP